MKIIKISILCAFLIITACAQTIDPPCYKDQPPPGHGTATITDANGNSRTVTLVSV